MPDNQPQRRYQLGPRSDRLRPLVLLLLRLLALGVLTEFIPGCGESPILTRRPVRADVMRIVEDEQGYDVVPAIHLDPTRAPKQGVGAVGYRRTVERGGGWILPTVQGEIRILRIEFWDERKYSKDDEHWLAVAYGRSWRTNFPAYAHVVNGVERGSGCRIRWLWWNTLAQGGLVLLVLRFLRWRWYAAKLSTWKADPLLVRFYEGFCPRCGYNIRYAPEMRCSECGLRWRAEDQSGEAARPGLESPRPKRPKRPKPVRVRVRDCVPASRGLRPHEVLAVSFIAGFLGFLVWSAAGGDTGVCPVHVSNVRWQLQTIRRQVGRYNAQNPETPYDAMTPTGPAFWDPLVHNGHLPVAPVNPLQDWSSLVAAAPAQGAGWVWAEALPCEPWTLNLYAVDGNGAILDWDRNGVPD
jgi:hypothetical protein